MGEFQHVLMRRMGLQALVLLLGRISKLATPFQYLVAAHGSGD
jgi:hypothetical protein